jgi:hypothetical protein
MHYWSRDYRSTPPALLTRFIAGVSVVLCESTDQLVGGSPRLNALTYTRRQSQASSTAFRRYLERYDIPTCAHRTEWNLFRTSWMPSVHESACRAGSEGTDTDQKYTCISRLKTRRSFIPSDFRNTSYIHCGLELH